MGAWENWPFPSWSSVLLHLSTCFKAGLGALDLKHGALPAPEYWVGPRVCPPTLCPSPPRLPEPHSFPCR